MSARVVIVTGTGTGIGKTHATAALLAAWARVLSESGFEAPQVAGLKPVESGVVAGSRSDVLELEQASTFHVKRFPPPYMLARPVSPHLAAAAEGRRIELPVLAAYVAQVRDLADGIAVELPGGLFTPLAPGLDNAALALALRPDAVLLVAPDRLGVLHDVAAATRAAAALGLGLAGVVLVAPEQADASTGTNARELVAVTAVPVVAELPRAPVATLAMRADLTSWLRAFATSKSP
jgi:dethiobiotin synthetase